MKCALDDTPGRGFGGLLACRSTILRSRRERASGCRSVRVVFKRSDGFSTARVGVRFHHTSRMTDLRSRSSAGVAIPCRLSSFSRFHASHRSMARSRRQYMPNRSAGEPIDSRVSRPFRWLGGIARIVSDNLEKSPGWTRVVQAGGYHPAAASRRRVGCLL